jgi:hypothetical protein
MDESESWTVDIDVHRRILTFLNSARRADDLMVPPPHEVLIVDEQLMEADERLHHDELHDAHDHEETTTKKAEALLDRDLAKRLLRARDDYNPLHGFRHVSQLRKIPGFDRAVLDRLIVLFSPRFRGDWELLYDDAD